MKKEIKQITNTSVGITFTAQERKVYGLKVGSVIDISDMVVLGPHNFPSAKGDELDEN